MMRYYIISDIHGNFMALQTALSDNGFDRGDPHHKIIFLGDAFDHGKNPTDYVDVYLFLKALVETNKLIWILGNHETELLSSIKNRKFGKGNHDTAVALASYYDSKITTDSTDGEISCTLEDCGLVEFINNNTCDFYELGSYVFTHGFIPTDNGKYDPNWRSVPREKWNSPKVRKGNGVKAVMKNGVRVPDKIIVCGHVGAYYGHIKERYPESDYDTSEFKKIAATMCRKKLPEDYKIYYGDGVIAIDGNAHATGILNCLIIDD